MSSFYSADAECPYYLSDNLMESTITCEGFAPGSTVRSHFSGKKAIARQMKKYCAGDYESCPWFRLASVKWED